MLNRVNVIVLLRDQYRPYRHLHGRRWHLGHVMLFGIVPACVGVGAGLLVGPLNAAAAGTMIAAFSVLAAVMTALVSVVHSLVGNVRIPEPFDPGARRVAEQVVARLEVLRELYTSITFAVLTQVFGVVILTLTFLPLPVWVDSTLTCLALGVAAVALMVLLTVALGVYQSLTDEADRRENELRKAAPFLRVSAPVSAAYRPSPEAEPLETRRFIGTPALHRFAG